MNLVLSDRLLAGFGQRHPELNFIGLSALHIANCVGCFGCWTKTPGRCVIRDDAVGVYPLIAASGRVLYLSRIRYGGDETVMKTMLERSIAGQQAFIRLFEGETHHLQRAVVPKDAVIIGYGDICAEEQALFRRLVERNAKNMCFAHYTIRFVLETEIETAVEEEVAGWKNS